MDKTISFTNREWEDLLNWIRLMDDSSFSRYIAELIRDKVEERV